MLASYQKYTCLHPGAQKFLHEADFSLWVNRQLTSPMIKCLPESATLKETAMDNSGNSPAARGPCGPSITEDDLPSPDTRRWVPSRKAIVVNAVRGGLVSLQTVLDRYHMTEQEFRSWEQGLEAHGTYGLKITKLQLRPRPKR